MGQPTDGRLSKKLRTRSVLETVAQKVERGTFISEELVRFQSVSLWLSPLMSAKHRPHKAPIMKKYLLPVIVDLLQAARDCQEESIAKDIVLMAQKHLNSVAREFDKSIESVRHIYESDGFIPAIKEWRALTGKGLKESKEDVERAADGGKWKYYLIGKTMRINSRFEFHGELCVVINAARGGEYSKVRLCRNGDEHTFNTNQLTEIR